MHIGSGLCRVCQLLSPLSCLGLNHSCALALSGFLSEARHRCWVRVVAVVVYSVAVFYISRIVATVDLGGHLKVNGLLPS